ncbi:ppsC [Symbiodinium sp. CCMP2592]|nr:ppsC [Symbiodinium sp. CCMP2592]
MKDRYLNTKFLLNQSRNPFPASLLQELPSLAALQREGERVPLALRSSPLRQFWVIPLGSVEFQIMRLKRIIELHVGEQRMMGQMEDTPLLLIALTLEEIEAQIAMGTRSSGPSMRRGMMAPTGKRKYRRFSRFGHTYSARHLYAVWSHLPITIKAHKRGIRTNSTNLQRRDDRRALMKEAKEFVILHDLPVPTTDQEWKQLYREMGSFFAAKVFINRTPQVVLDLPVADIHDSKAHMRLRAVCDERITLPLNAFRHFPEIYSSLSNSLGQEAMVEIKMAWRCNTEQWWTARLKPEYAAPIYRKLGYSESYVQGLGLGDMDTSAAFGAERILMDPGSEQERALPPVTPDNVSSVASDDYKRKAGDKAALGQNGIVDKKKGETRGGYVCRRCRGFWRGAKGASSSTEERLFNSSSSWMSEAWVKDRIEFYKRVEPTTAPPDRSLRVNPSLSSRLRFSKTNLMGHVSDMIWSVVLSNPERDGFKKIHERDRSIPSPPGLSPLFEQGTWRGNPCQVLMALKGVFPSLQVTFAFLWRCSLPGAFGPEGDTYPAQAFGHISGLFFGKGNAHRRWGDSQVPLALPVPPLFPKRGGLG